LDAYFIGILRPDGHRLNKLVRQKNGTQEIINDCLHNCYETGKLDVYNQLVLHYLRLHQSETDLEQLKRLVNSRIEMLRQKKAMAFGNYSKLKDY